MWALIPACLAFMLSGITESLLPFLKKPLFYLWFWKLALPLGGLFIHEWFVTQNIWTG